MDKEWQVDLSVVNIPNISGLLIAFAISLISVIIAISEVTWVVLIITSAYIANGKEWLMMLLSAKAYKIEFAFVLITTVMLFISAFLFFITSTLSLVQMNRVSNKKNKTGLKFLYLLFFIALLLLGLTMVATVLLKFYASDLGIAM